MDFTLSFRACIDIELIGLHTLLYLHYNSFLGTQNQSRYKNQFRFID